LVTFEPHPLSVVNPQMAPPLLTTGGERREALALTDLDHVWVVRFDRELASLEPEQFVEQLVDSLGMKELVIGHDHGFGRGRSGDAQTLKTLGQRLGFTVDVVAPVEMDGHVVSSTAVRRMVGGGDLAGAAKLLGRPYVVVGKVEHGAGRGRTIGIPTANLGGVPANKLLPPDGVYAARVETRTGRYGGMLNQGGKPTFGDGRRSIEVHLFGFEGDLYDEWVKVEWVRRLRDVRKFDGPAQLIAQLHDDRARAEAVLAEGPTRQT
jgi:riboflavin kinase/FMN adenylyltransferase